MYHVLNKNPGLDQQVYNMPSASQVAANLMELEESTIDSSYHIQVYTRTNSSHRIYYGYACYDPLQYPLLFLNGESGWHYNIKRLPPCTVHLNNFQDNWNEYHIPNTNFVYDLLQNEEKSNYYVYSYIMQNGVVVSIIRTIHI